MQNKTRSLVRFLIAALVVVSPLVAARQSQCFGTPSNGRVEDSVKLPLSGPNFTAFSTLAATAGRTHVHSKVAGVVTTAYAALHAANPSATYVYGETGWPSGGRFRPHRTHQNGLSVDFFVPVRDAKGDSVPFPTTIMSRFGYDIEFDDDARFGKYTIDFSAMAEHLYQLHRTAKASGVEIQLVIFDTKYFPRLFATPRGAYLQKNLPFMKGKPWIRHDEHYHVDFAVACHPKSK